MEENPEPASVNLEKLHEERRARLARFTNRIKQDDIDIVDHWRNASSLEHAVAMSQLSDYAHQLSVQTELVKDPTEMFPGFPKTHRASEE